MDISRSVHETWTSFVRQAEQHVGSELEIRFSTFIPRDLYQPMEHAEFKRPPNYKFKPWVDETSFHRVLSTLHSFNFSIIETQSEEYIYNDGLKYICPIVPQGSPFYLRKSRERFGGNFDIFQYGVRLSLTQELPLPHAPKGIDMVFPNQKRLKHRVSFIDTKLPSIRFDLTRVTTDYMNGDNPRTCYEVEVEYIRAQGGCASDLLEACNFVLRVLQCSYWLITLPERHNALNDFAQLTGGKTHFIGAQPETLQRRHLSQIASKPYSVTEKIDGERCLLLIRKSGQVVLINRKMQVRDTGMSLSNYTGTILDIELLQDTLCHVFDVIAFCGQDLRGKHEYLLRKRLEIADSIVKAFNCPERVVMKKFVWSIADISQLTANNNGVAEIPKDGYIFTPLDECYPTRAGWTSLLKWKPPNLNSVDFLLVINKDGTPSVHVGLRDNTTVPFEPCSKVIVDSSLLSRNGCIVECVYDADEDAWTVMRVREDKTKPNYHKVAENVWESIQEPLSIDDIKASTVSGPATFEGLRNAHNKLKSQLITKSIQLVTDGNSAISVLDLGCGRGGDLFKWDKHPNVKCYTGVDINETFLLEAKERSKGLKNMVADFVQCDLSKDFPHDVRGSFDIISCQFCFHYFYQSPQALATVIGTIRHFLKDDGILVITTMDGFSVWDFIINDQQVQDDTSKIMFKLVPTCNFKIGLDVLRRQEFGIGVKVHIEGEKSLILNQYHQEEYLVFADLLVNQMSKYTFELIETELFDVSQNLSPVEKHMSNLNRFFVFRKKKTCSFETCTTQHITPSALLLSELNEPNDLVSVSFSYPLTRILSYLLGVNIVEDDCPWTEETMIATLDTYRLNLVFGIVEKKGVFVDFVKYVYPSTFAEDVRVIYIDQHGNVIGVREPNSKSISCLWDPSESIILELKTGSNDASSSKSVEQTCSSTDITIMGKNVNGRGKDSWSLKDLRDLAKEKDITLPPSAKKKLDIAMVIKQFVN
jgi:SAM-dependent methyltransferase